MFKVLVFSTNSAKLAALGVSFACLATIGCGNATTATPVQAAAVLPAVPVAVAAVGNEEKAAADGKAAAGAAATGDWGTIKGKILAGGPVERLKLLIAKGDNTAKDAAVCSAQDVPDEALIVDAKTGGIANVVVYLQKKPATVHPELEASKIPVIDFDQKGCRFLPHVMLVRTDQQVRVLSGDNVLHNTHTNPIKNKGENFAVTANDRIGVVVPNFLMAEKVPVTVNCDIHSWMKAYWVVLDHPYAAITKEDGTFEIKDLPVGNHVFIVWQEGVGYLNRTYAVTVKPGVNELKPLTFSVEVLTPKETTTTK